MGIDCGFDVYPRLKPTEENKQSYQEFINEIIEKYQNTWVNNCVIQFAVGEYPSIPARPEHCYYFLRFSSKVSKGNAESFIRDVYEIAQKHFGEWCIDFWHELCETNDARQYGHHDWEKVHAARHKCEDIVRVSDAVEAGCR